MNFLATTDQRYHNSPIFMPVHDLQDHVRLGYVPSVQALPVFLVVFFGTPRPLRLVKNNCVLIRKLVFRSIKVLFHKLMNILDEGADLGSSCSLGSTRSAGAIEGKCLPENFHKGTIARHENRCRTAAAVNLRVMN